MKREKGIPSNTDHLVLIPSIREFESEDGAMRQSFNLDMSINGVLFTGYIDHFSLLASYRYLEPDWEYRTSDFYPFNCSCGIGGCAGIYDGIYFRPRKHSIEWRIPKRSGYNFLDKRFYSFFRDMYEHQLLKVYDFILSNPDILDGTNDTCTLGEWVDWIKASDDAEESRNHLAALRSRLENNTRLQTWAKLQKAPQYF